MRIEEKNRGIALDSLISNEIERQNVVEEDAEQVEDISQDISWYLNEYVHRDCDYQVYSAMCDLFSELEKITLNALKAYRKEPCEWCKDKTEDDFGYSEVRVVYARNNFVEERWEKIHTKHCPNCGRKL